ncbi:MAG: hypothetical protein ACKOOD_03285 [Microbacteriaceae bacterium]
MIRIFSIFPDRLNLNGDAANAMVLAKQLSWSNFAHEVVIVDSFDAIKEAVAQIAAGDSKAVLIFGHGSKAAVASLAEHRPELQALANLCRRKKAVGLVVGSSLGLIQLENISLTTRRSEFVVAQQQDASWPSEALGYLNSDLDVQPLEIDGWLIQTTLHGPFLAKNGAWTRAILERVGARLDLANQERIEAFEAKVWQLEAGA